MQTARIGMVVVCAGIAITASLTGCSSKGKKTTTTSKTAPPVAKQATPAAGAHGSAAFDDDSDENGDDGDRGTAVKFGSAKADADDSAAMRARLAAQDFSAAQSAPGGKKPPPAKVVAKKDRGSCGEITIGKRTYKLDCSDENYGKIKGASEQLLKEDDITGAMPAAKLPDIVDFRSKKLTGPLIDQGQTLTCTAVSLATVVDHELMMLTGKPSGVSPMNIWARYANPSMDEAITTNEGKPIVPMTLWPYDWKLADKWDKGKPPPPDILAKVEPASVAKIVDVVQIAPKDIKGTLAQGHAVWFALKAAHNMQNLTPIKGSSAQLVTAYDWREVPANQQMGHAIALVGYQTMKSGKTFYLIQNSWGADWGDKGFAYIDDDTFLKNLGGAYTVEVEAVGAGTKPASAVGALPPTKCKPGLLPDAVTGKCAAKCADGSPRSDNACVEAGDCPAGEVNVKGHCVRAAPTLKIKKENYAINCVPGGCLYGFAKGTAGCTRDTGCVAACAAPHFKLVKTAKGIRCN